MEKNYNREILKHIKKITPFHPVAVQIIKLINNESFTNEELVNLIQIDPIITSKCITICNSPYIGLRSKVTSIEGALIILGWESIFKIVQNIGSASINFNNFKLWLHHVGVALLTKIIFLKLKEKNINSDFNYQTESNLYICGLIHDIGKIITYSFPDVHRFRVELYRLKYTNNINQIENKFYGTTSNTITQKILKLWNFPDLLINLIISQKTTNFSKLPIEIIQEKHILELANIFYDVFNLKSTVINFIISENILEQFQITDIDVKQMQYDYFKEMSNIGHLLNLQS